MKNAKNSYVAVVGRRRKTTKFFQNWRQSAEATGAYGIWSHSARGECTRTLYVIIMKWGVIFFVWGLCATFQEISAHREKEHDLNYASVSPLWLWPERRHRPPAERRIKYDITCDEQDGGLSSVVSQVSSVLRFLYCWTVVICASNQNAYPFFRRDIFRSVAWHPRHRRLRWSPIDVATVKVASEVML